MLKWNSGTVSDTRISDSNSSAVTEIAMQLERTRWRSVSFRRKMWPLNGNRAQFADRKRANISTETVDLTAKWSFPTTTKAPLASTCWRVNCMRWWSADRRRSALARSAVPWLCTMAAHNSTETARVLPLSYNLTLISDRRRRTATGACDRWRWIWLLLRRLHGSIQRPAGTQATSTSVWPLNIIRSVHVVAFVDGSSDQTPFNLHSSRRRLQVAFLRSIAV